MAELPLVGTEFAGYRLVSVLGRGGMSVVFRAENPRLGNVIALKVLDPSLATDDTFRARFLEESRIAASMNHPNVIPLHDMGASAGLLYIAMRCVTGTDLRQMIKKRGQLPAESAVFLLDQAARALDAAHRRGLVHRDVKPGNLLVERGNDGTDPAHVYLADFGLTKQVSGRTGLTSSADFAGTVDYIAPEQIRGLSVSGQADQYSLGCVLYECLTGQVPFEKDLDAAIIWAHLEESATLPTAARPELPPALDEVFARVLAKNPGDRFESCKDFMTAVREALGPMADQPRASSSLPMRLPGAGPTPRRSPRPPAPFPGPHRSPASGSDRGEQPVLWFAAHPPAEFTHEAGDAYQPDAYLAPAAYQAPAPAYQAPDAYQAPTANWPAAASPAPPPPPGPARTGGSPPGGDRRRRQRRRDWVIVAVALLLVAGASAIITVAVTGKGTPRAGSTLMPAGMNMGSATASPAASGASPAGASVSSVPLPTVAGKVQAGQTPSYIQVAPDGKFAYIANPGAGTISVLDTASDKVSETVKVPQGPPQFVSFSADSKTAFASVYTTRGSVHLIAFIDTATGTVTATVPVDNFTPGPSAASPDGRYLYVPNHNTAMSGVHENDVDVIDIATRQLVSDISVPANPHWVAFDKNGHLYTTDHMSGKVTVVSTKTNSVITNIVVGETPHSEVISPDGSRLAVTSFDGNEVFIIDTATEKEIAQIAVGKNPLDIAYSPDGRYLFTVDNEADEVTVIDTASDRVIGEIPAGKAPTSISVLPGGQRAYVTDDGDGTIEILNLPK